MSKITVDDVLSALRAGGVKVDDRHRHEAEIQVAAANRSPEGRKALRNDLTFIRRRGRVADPADVEGGQ